MSTAVNGNSEERTITAERANGRVPAWLEKLGITGQGDSTYFMDTKPRARRAMRSEFFSPAARVHICLGLHTLGFQAEDQKAVKLEAGKKVPLAPADIANETGLQKQNVRPALRELEAEGLAEVKGSTKGHVEIYAYAVPRPVDSSKNGNSRHYHSGDFPPQVLSFLQKFRIRLPDGFVMSREYIETVEAAARDYQNAEMVLKRALKGNPAQECIYKEERNERNIQETVSSSSVPIPIETTTTIPPEPPTSNEAKKTEMPPCQSQPDIPAESSPVAVLTEVLTAALQAHPIGGMPSQQQIADLVPLLPAGPAPEVIRAFGIWLTKEKLIPRKLKNVGGLPTFTCEFARIYVHAPPKAAKQTGCKKCRGLSYSRAVKTPKGTEYTCTCGEKYLSP